MFTCKEQYNNLLLYWYVLYIYDIFICKICLHIIIPIHGILNIFCYPALMKNQAVIGCKKTADFKWT